MNEGTLTLAEAELYDAGIELDMAMQDFDDKDNRSNNLLKRAARIEEASDRVNALRYQLALSNAIEVALQEVRSAHPQPIE